MTENGKGAYNLIRGAERPMKLAQLPGIITLLSVGCAGSVIGGKYGLGNNQQGYAEEARVRQERRDRLAAARAEFNRICMEPQTQAQANWCRLRGHELDRAEDRLERQEDREDANERDFQNRREQRRAEIFKKDSVDCTTTGYGNTSTTHCQ
ncbi:MAG TPA: hypothetical protein VJ801_11995 [Polyangia bacterium]|nr:hypothetical protein [Polyangia bacterium]